MPACLRICQTVDGASLYPQAGQFAVDAPVAPARVIPCHLHRQRPDGLRRARPPRNAVRVRPALLDKIGVPAQHRPRGDDQAQLPEAAPGQQPGQRRQDRPVGPRQLRRLDLALEDGNLMTQEQDLGIFGPIGASEKGEPAEHAEHRQVGES